MKYFFLIVLAAVASFTRALAPPSSGRRAFLKESLTTSVVASVVATQPLPAFAKVDEYSLDSGDIKAPVKEKTETGSGSGIVAAALGGSVLLSLPFFLPNLLRLAGVKNAKLPKK